MPLGHATPLASIALMGALPQVESAATLSPYVAMLQDRHRSWHSSGSEIMELFRENISLRAIDKPLSHGLG
jgi:hypothetical protein